MNGLRENFATWRQATKELERHGQLSEAIAGVQDAKTRQLAAHEAELRSQIGGAEEGLKGLRTNVHRLQELRASLQVKMARFESDLKHLEEIC